MWVTLVATNRGSTCELINDCIPFVRVRNAAGQSIATTMTPPGSCLQYPQEAVKHDQPLTHSYPWNQQPLNDSGTYTTGNEVSRGDCTLTVDWHSLGVGPSVTITLTQ